MALMKKIRAASSMFIKNTLFPLHPNAQLGTDVAEEFEHIQVELERTVYIPGEKISGSVYVSLPSPVPACAIGVTIQGIVSAFEGLAAPGEKSYYSEYFFVKKITLWRPEDIAITNTPSDTDKGNPPGEPDAAATKPVGKIEAGDWDFWFEYFLPNNLPPTVQYEDWVSLSYKVTAYIEPPPDADPKTLSQHLLYSKPVTFRVRGANPEKFASLEPRRVEEKRKSMPIVLPSANPTNTTGELLLHAWIDTSHGYMGQIFPVHVRIVNNTPKTVQAVKITVKQKICITLPAYSKEIFRGRVMFSGFPNFQVPPGTTSQAAFNVRLPVQGKGLTASTGTLPTTTSTIFGILHYFNVRLDLKGRDTRVALPFRLWHPLMSPGIAPHSAPMSDGPFDPLDIDEASLVDMSCDSPAVMSTLSTSPLAASSPSASPRNSIITRRGVIKTGFLTKQGGKVKNWKRRFFVLTSTALTYYKSENDALRQHKPVGTIDLVPASDAAADEPASDSPNSGPADVRVEVADDVGRLNCFAVMNYPRRTYYLAADSIGEMAEWMEAIECAIQRSREARRNRDRLVELQRERASVRLSISSNALSSSPPSPAKAAHPAPNERRSNSGWVALLAPLKEGWLRKEGEIHKGWRKRWFVLRPGLLTYHKSQVAGDRNGGLRMVPAGLVALDDDVWIERAPQERASVPFCFKVAHPLRRTFYIAAADNAELEAWLKAINGAVQRTAPRSLIEPLLDDIPLNEASKPSRKNRVQSTSFFSPEAMRTIQKAGWLFKKVNQTARNQWKKRYFVLHGNVLYHFADPESTRPKGAVVLKGYSTRVLSQGEYKAVPPHPWVFEVAHPCQFSYLLCAETSDDRDNWVAKILEIIKQQTDV